MTPHFMVGDKVIFAGMNGVVIAGINESHPDDPYPIKCEFDDAFGPYGLKIGKWRETFTRDGRLRWADSEPLLKLKDSV
jgi:hypothetical protein